MNLTTLNELRQSPVAKTDVGDLIALGGLPQIEFLVKGTIKKVRAGLFFIDIEGENYTFPKSSTFKEGDEIICVLRAEVHSDNVELNNNHAHFTIKGLERSE
ncbi:MAG: hypothetical protein PHU51_04690 [Candidatus Nanoarchaeia archaeon]|nr:hypothetical protein [Candidatus Nanoarchaeia archaeon]